LIEVNYYILLHNIIIVIIV